MIGGDRRQLRPYAPVGSNQRWLDSDLRQGRHIDFSLSANLRSLMNINDNLDILRMARIRAAATLIQVSFTLEKASEILLAKLDSQH